MKGEGQNIYVYLKTQDSFPTKDRKSPGTVQNHETFLSTALDFEGFNLRKFDTCSCDDYDYILICVLLICLTVTKSTYFYPPT